MRTKSVPGLSRPLDRRLPLASGFGDVNCRAQKIRILRNRIAHHEPIITRNLAADLAAIKDLVTLRSGNLSQLLAAAEHVSSIIPRRP